MQRAWITALTASASLFGLTSGALAQNTQATPAEINDSGLEDIIVTAQKRSENIHDVSLAIQALTAEGLARSGIARRLAA